MDLSDINVSKIVVQKQESEIVKVVELVLAAAVQCDDKSVYIDVIMGMDQEAQGELMITIDRLISRLNGTDAPTAHARTSSAEGPLDSEMSATLTRENQALKRVSELPLPCQQARQLRPWSCFCRWRIAGLHLEWAFSSWWLSFDSLSRSCNRLCRKPPAS